MKYFYQAYGVSFESDIEFTELPETEVTGAQVRLVCARLPEQLALRTEERWFAANASQLWFRIRNVAEFLVEDGEKISVQIEPGADMALVRLFVIGSAFAALLHQRGALVLHGAVLTDGKTTVLFTGESGAGKSTMAAMLWKRGYSVVAEDVAVLYQERGEWLVYPGYPFMRICPDMLPLLELQTEPLELTRIFTHTEKYLLDLRDGFCRCPVRLDLMAVLGTTAAAEFSSEILPTNAEKFAALVNNTYRNYFLKDQGMLEKHFRQCASLLAQLKIMRISRPQAEKSIFAACDYAESVTGLNCRAK